MIEYGTDCKLKDKLKTDTDPKIKKEAKETKNNSANSDADKVKVLGNDTETTFLIDLKSGIENLGNRPDLKTKGICMAKWRIAPKTTPITKPMLPKTGYKKTTPAIIPRL